MPRERTIALDDREGSIDRTLLCGSRLITRRFAHSGMFPCLRFGRSTRFVNEASRASINA